MKALIFDMDGLMIDSERLYFETEKDMAEKLGKQVDDKLLWKLMGMSPLESMTIFKQELEIPESIEDLLKKRVEIMTYKYTNDLVPMKGLYDIIKSFYKKLKMGIATGSPKIFLDIVVDKLNIRKYFDVLQPSDEIKNGKPHPEIYLKTAGKLNLPPEECIVLEDSSNGIRSANAAGCYSIAVISDYTKYQDFSSAHAVFNNLTEAMDAIHVLLDKKLRN